MRKYFKNKKGFTLIELIVVIAILGILALIAIPRLTGFQQQARISADHSAFAGLENVVAVAVADGRLTAGTVTASTNAAGTIAWADTVAENAGTVLGGMLTKAPVFQLAANQNPAADAPLAAGEIAEWTITAAGGITLDTNTNCNLQ